jgi:quinol monooxygenase YgiN
MIRQDEELRAQPGYVIRMRAKPGCIDKLFEMATAGIEESGCSDRFILVREDDDPDVLWNVEIFKSDEVKEAYENGPHVDRIRGEIMELLAEPFMRVAVHPYSSAP